MGGEGGPAHAHDAGGLDDVADLLRREALRVLGGVEVGTGGVVEVVFNDHAHHRHAGEVEPGLHRRHRAGHAGVDRRGDEGRGLPHHLPHGHAVPHRHAGLAGGPDVQGHGDHHPGGRRKQFDRLLIGSGLLVVGMDAAKKRLCHIFTSFSFLAWAPGPDFYGYHHTPIFRRCPGFFR